MMTKLFKSVTGKLFKKEKEEKNRQELVDDKKIYIESLKELNFYFIELNVNLELAS